jgi:hypothetical protein
MEGQRPTVKGLRAAPWLPIAEVEPRHDDPIVIPAGTWVGVVNEDGASTGAVTPYTGLVSNGTAGHGVAVESYLVPACSEQYKVQYSTKDTDTTFHAAGTINLANVDDGGGTLVTAAGLSSLFVGQTGVGIKPLGIAYQDIYASWINDNYLNYEKQPNIGFLMSNQIIQVPAVTAQEQVIKPGDLVMIDGHTIPTETGRAWDPTNTNVAAYEMRVGHLISVQDANAGARGSDALVPHTTAGPGASEAWLAGVTGAVTAIANSITRQPEWIVGRCVRRIKIAAIGESNTYAALSANIPSARSNVNVEWRHASRVQTVPGLGLQGSGTLGIPGHLLTARADAEGFCYALEIAVGTY